MGSLPTDGKVGGGESKEWVTGPEERAFGWKVVRGRDPTSVKKLWSEESP